MKISIQSLKQGVTVFSEKISADFIEKEYSKFYPNDFIIDVVLDKFDRDIRLKVVIRSIASFVCDSCLAGYGETIEVKQEQLYEVGPAPDDMEDEIIYLTPDTIEIDLTRLLFEGVVLNHPIRMQCKIDCKGLCAGCGTDLNLEKCKCGEKDIDPRWENLRKLIK